MDPKWKEEKTPPSYRTYKHVDRHTETGRNSGTRANKTPMSKVYKKDLLAVILLGGVERAHASLGREIQTWAASGGDEAMGFASGGASAWSDKDRPQQ